jgi:tetratricopeptide (TPR) repeat protein
VRKRQETLKLNTVEKYKKAVEENPDSATAHMKLGTALISRGKTKQAEQELLKATELDPKCIPAWINLGGILMARWDFPGCIDANLQALAVDPDLVEAHYNKGLGYLYLNKPAEMIVCFERVVEIDDSHAAGFYHLAVGLLAMGDQATARKTLAKALDLGYKPEPQFLKAFESGAGNKQNITDMVSKPLNKE